MRRVVSPTDPAPVRLLAGGGTEYERRLLEAAELDVMPAGTSERLAHALAARGDAGARAVERAPGVLGATAASLGARLARLVVIGGLGGAAAIGLLRWERGSVGGPSLATAPSAVSAPETPRAPAEVVASPEAPPAPPAAPAPHAPPTPARVVPGAEPAPRRALERALASSPPPLAPPEPGSRGGLLEEVRLLDAARAALRGGHGEQARTVLDTYHQRFERGELRLEADVLEADLLLFQGHADGARLLVRKLQAKSGTERYRARLAQIERRAELALRGSAPPMRGEPRPALSPDGPTSAGQQGSISSGPHMGGRR